MKIDIYTHIVTPRYLEALMKKNPALDGKMVQTMRSVKSLTDLDERFRVMDKHPEVAQVLVLGGNSIDRAVKPEDADELCRIANDEMAELVDKYSSRFVGAVASLPMADMDMALRETDRCIKTLKMKGIRLFTDVRGEPIDQPQFRLLYQKMSEYDLPIWLHPSKPNSEPDYVGEKGSRYMACMFFAWPYQTTLAMNRLVFSGIMEDFPRIKIITHHCGAMVPSFAARIEGLYDYNLALFHGEGFERQLKKPALEYFRQFYTDTMTWGSLPALTCGYSFFGAERILFGTDMPYDDELGVRVTRDTIQAIEKMEIGDHEKTQIFVGNAKKLLKYR